MQTNKILVVDDDELMLAFVVMVLRQEGYDVTEAKDPLEALRLIKQQDFDIVVSDVKMPHLSGIELMTEANKFKPLMKWIFLTAFATVQEAVQAVKKGAIDYLMKPLESPDILRQCVKNALLEAKRDKALITNTSLKNLPPLGLIFAGSEMQKIKELVLTVAPTQTTVLITGPTGTGKELIARTIHQFSKRADKPFVAVNCAALSATVLESELFGHEKGSFTGATHLRKGRFELAAGGTIFLDEIAEISHAVQVKLLRVLQERVIERVGSNTEIPVDIRILTATNKDLKAEIAKGNFREDLFYRLNVFPIELPALSKRKDAIMTLAMYFLQKHSSLAGKHCRGFSDDATRIILEYPWPGNIRELQNVIERAVLLAGDIIEPAHLNISGKPTDLSPQASLNRLDDIEKQTILEALQKTGGNKKKTAELLGISRRTLYYKLQSLKQG